MGNKIGFDNEMLFCVRYFILFYEWFDSFRKRIWSLGVCLGSAYFAETEKLFVENTVDKGKSKLK